MGKFEKPCFSKRIFLVAEFSEKIRCFGKSPLLPIIVKSRTRDACQQITSETSEKVQLSFRVQNKSVYRRHQGRQFERHR